jgi:hypothetical protein
METKSFNSLSVFSAIALIILGGVLLFFQAQPQIDPLLLRWWPALVILLGGGLLYAASRGRSRAPIAVPGALVTGTGLILLYQSLTEHWGSWAYVWTLYGLFLGVGLWLNGHWSDDHTARRAAVILMTLGMVGFLGFGAFFELLIFGHRPGSPQNVLWPLVLIGFGVGLLGWRYFISSRA